MKHDQARRVLSSQTGQVVPLDRVLKELRSTKQQLNHLETIQQQLADVQAKLDEQFQVLKHSISSQQLSQHLSQDLVSKESGKSRST